MYEKEFEILTIEKLEKDLKNAGVDTSSWGKGEAKTLSHLYKELKDGGSQLVTDKDGELLRIVTYVGVDVFYKSPEGKSYRLKEDKQVFNDGRVRSRNYGHAVSEKIKYDENPELAAVRGIKEELGLEDDIEVSLVSRNEERLTSSSYPGLLSQYIGYKFTAYLNQEQFNPNGYQEVQEDKITYFVWEEFEE